MREKARVFFLFCINKVLFMGQKFCLLMNPTVQYSRQQISTWHTSIFLLLQTLGLVHSCFMDRLRLKEETFEKKIGEDDFYFYNAEYCSPLHYQSSTRPSSTLDIHAKKGFVRVFPVTWFLDVPEKHEFTCQCSKSTKWKCVSKFLQMQNFGMPLSLS